MILAWLALGCGLTLDPGEDPPEAPHKPARERLEDALPGLGAESARVFGPDEADLDPVADLVEAGDRALVRLLLPRRVAGPQADLLGEVVPLRGSRGERAPEADLLEAEASLHGTVLHARVVGQGVGEGGGALELDVRGGPAPDLLVRVPADGTMTWSPLRNWVEGPAQAIAGEASLHEDAFTLTVDLAGTGLLEAGHAGAAVARVHAGEGAERVVDRGPAGRLGTPTPHALHVLRALMASKDVDVMDDPDLSLAVALGFGPWRGWVAQDVRATVDADAVGWLRYGLDLDAWLARKEAGWSLARTPAEGKLAWAWPGAQAVAYGTLAVGLQESPLSLARYRFAVPDVATLTAWRDALPLGKTVAATADARDIAIWDDLRYRATPAAMDAVCGSGRVRSNMCAGWARDAAQGADLGQVDGVRIPMDGGVSASHQLRVRADEHDLIGDCATATTVAIAAMQAVGVPAIAVGYVGPSWEWPTHVQPAVLQGERFVSPQTYPSAKWSSGSTWAYALVPVLDPSLGAALGGEPGGGARGPGVVGGATTYGALSAWGEAGIPLSTVYGWVRDGMDGGWGELAP